jgi:phage/plasmid-like protein (TIGR03299 family)
MAHEVCSLDKVAYGASDAIPWHQVNCHAFSPNESFQDQLKKSSVLNYQVATVPLKPVWATNEQNLEVSEEDNPVRHKATYRTDTGEVFGVVGPRWEPYQNDEAAKVIEPLVERGILKLHTAGTLRNGARMWIQCETGEDVEIVPGDDIRRFFTFSMGHDGLLGINIGFTAVRIVCANTLRASLEDSFSKHVRIHHNGNIAVNVENLIEGIDFEKQQFEATTEKFKFLASRGVNKDDLRKWCRIVTDPQNIEKKWEEVSTRRKNIIEHIELLADLGTGNNVEGVQGTWWAAYNGLTQYLSHEHGRTPESRLEALWFGSSARMLERAVDVALTLAS